MFKKKNDKKSLVKALYYCNRNFQGQPSGQNKFIIAAVHIKEIGKDKSDPCGINNSDDDCIYKNFLFNRVFNPPCLPCVLARVQWKILLMHGKSSMSITRNTY